MPKYPIPSKEAREERVRILLLASIQVLQQEAGAFIQEGEFGQVGGVLPGGLEDEPELLAHGAGAEEEDHDEGVGEADFGAVNGAVAEGFEQDEGLFILRVEEDVLL
jgi:hypothetical protein